MRAVPWPTTAICRAFASALFCFAKVEHPFTLAGRTGYRSQAQTRRCVRSLAPALSRRAVERSGGLSEQHLETRKLRSHFCYLFPFSRDAYFGITPGDKCIGKGALRFMAYIHAITAGDLQRALYAVSLLVSILLDEFLLVAWRGFGRGGLGSGRARIVQSIQGSVRASVHHLARANRASGPDRLRRLPLLHQPPWTIAWFLTRPERNPDPVVPCCWREMERRPPRN